MCTASDRRLFVQQYKSKTHANKTCVQRSSALQCLLQQSPIWFVLRPVTTKLWHIQPLSCHQAVRRYYFDTANKPEILSINGQSASSPIPALGYNQTFTLEWTGPAGVTVTSVALAAPSAVTHSYDMNQRIIQLRVVSSSTGTVTLLTPANSAVAPPQMYMIFALNGKTYGSSKWIKLAL
jgi:hypothetical protein